MFVCEVKGLVATIMVVISFVYGACYILLLLIYLYYQIGLPLFHMSVKLYRFKFWIFKHLYIEHTGMFAVSLPQ